MGKLYIIGNGFDMHYKLKTTPDDFVDFLKNERIYNETEDALSILQNMYGVWWSDFEEDISYIDLQEVEEQNLEYPDYLSDHESDRDGCITNMEEYLDSISEAIFNALGNMVDNANNQLKNISKGNVGFDFLNGDYILSFNYTSTIEQLFDLPNEVWVEHIHGFREDSERLILGYHESNSDYHNKITIANIDDDYYVDIQKRLIDDFYQNLKKEIQEERLINFLSKIKSLDEIVVLGHSLGKVDKIYFDIIDDTFKGLKWKVSYHSSNDVVLKNLLQYGFANRTDLFCW